MLKNIGNRMARQRSIISEAEITIRHAERRLERLEDAIDAAIGCPFCESDEDEVTHKFDSGECSGCGSTYSYENGIVRWTDAKCHVQE